MRGDPRLERLLTNGFRCKSCDQVHHGVFDVAFSTPMYWSGGAENDSDEAVKPALAEARDILTKNFCLDGEHRFVRGIIPFGIHESEETFAFGVWGSLSPHHFQQYLDGFFAPEADLMPPLFSWLSNRLPGSEDRPFRCRMHSRPRPDRPVFEIGEEYHPFFAAQTEGLSFDALLDIYKAFGHDLRASLDE